MPVNRITETTPSSSAAAGSTKIDATLEPSPPRYVESHEARIGGFLERCHYCKKRISQDSEVFMYRGLCAFCSLECRANQISLDKSGKNKLLSRILRTASQIPTVGGVWCCRF